MSVQPHAALADRSASQCSPIAATLKLWNWSNLTGKQTWFFHGKSTNYLHISEFMYIDMVYVLVSCMFKTMF